MRARSLHGLEATILLRDVTKVSRVHLKDVTRVLNDVDVDFEVLLEDVTRVLEGAGHTTVICRF